MSPTRKFEWAVLENMYTVSQKNELPIFSYNSVKSYPIWKFLHQQLENWIGNKRIQKFPPLFTPVAALPCETLKIQINQILSEMHCFFAHINFSYISFTYLLPLFKVSVKYSL